MYKFRWFAPRENPEDMESVVNKICEDQGYRIEETTFFKKGVLFVLKKL